MTLRRVAAAVALLALNLSLATALLWPQRALVRTGANDFLSFYAGGRLAFQEDLYRVEAIQAVQRECAGTASPKLGFIRLPFYAAALWLPARLPYHAAYALWQLLQLAALLALLVLLPASQRFRWLWAISASAPLAWSFANAQDLPFMLLLLTASAALGANDRHFASGLLLSLGLIKPHLILLVPVVFLRTGRRTGLAGFALGFLALVAVSFFVSGWAWPADYARLLWSSDIHGGLDRAPNWHGLSRMLFGSDALGWALSLATAVLVVLWAPRLDWGRGWAAAMAGSLLVVPHLFVQDLVLLIPGCLWLLARDSSGWRGTVAFLLLTPVPYLFHIALPTPSGVLPALLLAGLLSGIVTGKATEGPQTLSSL